MSEQKDYHVKFFYFFKESIKNIPLLKYSWILIAAVYVLCTIKSFQLQTFKVLIFATILIVFCFSSLALLTICKSKTPYTRFLFNFFMAAITIVLIAGMLSIGSFIIFQKPTFYSRWFPDLEKSKTPVRPKEGVDDSLRQKAGSQILTGEETKIDQTHSGSGDNVAGDKIIKTE